MCVVDVNDFIPHRKSHLTVTLRHTGMPIMFIDFASFSTNDNCSYFFVGCRRTKMTVHRTISSCQKHTEYPRKYLTLLHEKKTAYAVKKHRYWNGGWGSRKIFAG